MKPFFIGITGGSGSGKTAMAKELKKYLGKRAAILHVDNYQRFGEKLPRLHGMANWDHPKSVNWNKLLKDSVSLKKGEAITIKSRDQKKLKKVKEKLFLPTKIIIIEGYLLFYKPAIRDLLDFKIYLEAGDKARIKRRTKFKNINYIQKILLPMHHKLIEPTKKFANLILDMEIYSAKQCVRQIIRRLPKWLRCV